jgi:3-phosphoshikimate 1-carboxyvinyltransferase
VFELANIGLNPTRIGALSVLRRMGADILVGSEGIDYYEPYGTITVNASKMKGITVLPEEVPNVIDEIPILSVAALASEGEFSVRDAKELRVKESDRIDGVVRLVNAIGGTVEEFEDGFVISGPLTDPTNFQFDSKGDHRLAMSAIIAAISFGVEAEVVGCESIQTSFPNFFDILTFDLGIKISF